MNQKNQKQTLEDFVKAQNFDRLKAAQLNGSISEDLTDEQLEAFVEYKITRSLTQIMKEPMVDQLRDFMVSWNASSMSKQK